MLRYRYWIRFWAMLALMAAASLAGAGGVDVNRASPADLDAIKGVGPSMVERILAARQERPFANWADFSQRVRGVGPATAQRLSDNGLTVNGRRFGQDPPPVPQRWQPMLPQPLEPMPAPTPAQR